MVEHAAWRRETMGPLLGDQLWHDEVDATFRTEDATEADVYVGTDFGVLSGPLAREAYTLGMLDPEYAGENE